MKKFLKIAAGLLALAIISALAAPLFISADFLKAQLVAQVKTATGRELKIEGATTLSLFPAIAIRAEKVTLGNPAGFASPYFVKLETLSVGAALKPLLRKELVITGITLDGAVLNLEKNGVGSVNWAFASGAPVKKAEEKRAQESGKPKLSIGDILLSNSAVNYRVAGKAPVAITNIDLTLSGAASTPMKLDLRNASLFGGSVKGEVERNGDASNPRTEIDLDFTGVQIEPLLVAASGASKLTGTADLEIDVSTQGTTPEKMMAALNGEGALKVTDGAIKGMNVAQVLREAKSGFLVKNDETRRTDFSELTASFDIKNGVLRNDDLAMKAPALRLAGSGNTSLAAKTIDYRLVPTIVATAKGQGGRDDLSGLAVPILITGSWANPSIRPDVAGLIEEGLKNPEAVKKTIEDVGAAIKNPGDIGGLLKGF